MRIDVTTQVAHPKDELVMDWSVEIVEGKAFDFAMRKTYAHQNKKRAQEYEMTLVYFLARLNRTDRD